MDSSAFVLPTSLLSTPASFSTPSLKSSFIFLTHPFHAFKPCFSTVKRNTPNHFSLISANSERKTPTDTSITSSSVVDATHRPHVNQYAMDRQQKGIGRRALSLSYFMNFLDKWPSLLKFFPGHKKASTLALIAILTYAIFSPDLMMTTTTTTNVSNTSLLNTHFWIQNAYAYKESPSLTKELEPLTAQELSVIKLFETATPSVVFVTTYKTSSMSMNALSMPQGTGSGFVYDKVGHIVTNFHVIQQANSARITLSNKVTYNASLVGFDPDKDIAVLKIDVDPDEELVPIKLGSSSDLKVGQSTFAIGNPFGLDHTLTTGVVAGLGREVRSPNNRPITNVIQTDAAINPGNSGGPLLDSRGALIGMNTSIYSPSGASAGVGFAIPVDTLRAVVDELIKSGRVVRPVIGISYLESAQAKSLGISRGVLILDVPAGSPADKAGLRGTSRSAFGNIVLGDVIIGINDRPIESEADLFKILEKFKVGDKVNIEVVREGETKVFPVTLTARN